MFEIGVEPEEVTIFRIKNTEGRFLVEFGIEPYENMKIALWSWREERGVPIPSIREAEEVLKLLHHKNCSIVEGTMQLYVVDFW